jgi:hypothetical protein
VIRQNRIVANARSVIVKTKTEPHDCDENCCHCFYATCDDCDCCLDGECNCDECEICEEYTTIPDLSQNNPKDKK